MPISARSTPNIALIKYWGNRNNELRLPAADSLSMTLDTPHVEISVEPSDSFTLTSFEADGTEKILTEKAVARFRNHLELSRQYLKNLGVPDALPPSLSITVRSMIPAAIGLASSAAVFSCVAKCYAGLLRGTIMLTDEQTSVIARLGSGSAARSIYGGYSALIAGGGDEIGSSSAVQIADENHWALHDIIIVPEIGEKAIGSTEGHALAWSSPFYKERVKAMPARYAECRDAILQRDFEKLQRVTEEDALDMHHVMETSTPPLRYLSEKTLRIVEEVKYLRTNDHLSVLFTMDAGPTVHLLCTDDSVNTIRDFAQGKNECRIFEAKVGKGACIV